MRKINYKIVFLSFLVLAIYLISLPGYKSVTYLSRAALWGDSDVNDYQRFAFREISNGGEAYKFNINLKEEYIHALLKDITYKYKGKQLQIQNGEDFLAGTDTTAFIVIKDDTIFYEKYFNGSSRDSINTSFSVAKSFVSFLVGKAVEEGYVNSIEDPIANYLPELTGKGFAAITIRHLLMMSSGINYREGGLTLGDDAKTYYSPNLRQLALQETKVTGLPGEKFWYNNYHLLLLGMILERATGMSVSAYLQEKLWKPVGMEYPASWSIDSQVSGFEKMESGINARAIDYAKFGKLYLDKGNWQGQQLISEEWVHKSTATSEEMDRREYYANYPNSPHFQDDQGYYQYLWWGYSRDDVSYDFFAYGKYGQVIYISPTNNVIIVRNGKTTGQVDWWPAILRDLAEKLD